VPPSLGYNRFYSWVKRRYLGIRRADFTAFLNSQEGKPKYRRLFKPSKARVVSSKAPGIRWIMYIKLLPEVRLWNKFFVGVAVIVGGAPRNSYVSFNITRSSPFSPCLSLFSISLFVGVVFRLALGALSISLYVILESIFFCEAILLREVLSIVLVIVGSICTLV